ncbi:hypothetical protein EV715DRAFT_159683, partial [Schizophyllum commune]
LLERLLHESGHSLADFPAMPSPVRQWYNITENTLIAEQLNYSASAERQAAMSAIARM